MVSYASNYPSFEIDARESRWPTGSGPASAPPWRGLPEWEVPQAAPTNWCQTRADIAAAARAEERIWTTPNGSKFLESHPDRLPDLARYWSAVPGFKSAATARAAARRSARDEKDWPWSAAFICFVMKKAGVKKSDGFKFAGKHITYIVDALRNRERSDRARPFWLVDALELQAEAVPQVGDLLCFNRCLKQISKTCVRWTPHSVASLRRQFCTGGNQNLTPFGNAHCSFVVGFRTEPDGSRSVETIGGNEKNSVRLQHAIPVDQGGGIPNPQAHHIFGMIKLIGC